MADALPKLSGDAQHKKAVAKLDKMDLPPSSPLQEDTAASAQQGGGSEESDGPKMGEQLTMILSAIESLPERIVAELRNS